MPANLKYRINKFIRRNRPLILGYHGISDDDNLFPIWTHLDRGMFEQQLEFLSENFNCISMSCLSEQLHLGKFRPYSVVVTFDDGYRNNYVNAFPLLVKYNVPAIIFVTTNFIGTDRFIWSDKIAAMLAVSSVETVPIAGRSLPIADTSGRSAAYRHIVNNMKKHPPEMIDELLKYLKGVLQVTDQDLKTPPLLSRFGHLSWKEMIEMLESGLIEIGSHGMSHSILSNLPPSSAREEIVHSKAVIESNIGRHQSNLSFAYPNGGPDDYTPELRDFLTESGYAAGLTVSPERVSRLSHRYELPRRLIGNDCDIASFRYLMSH